MACKVFPCKADLAAAFEAARAAGWAHVSFVIEAPDGHRVEISAGSADCDGDTAGVEQMTPLEKWRTKRV